MKNNRHSYPSFSAKGSKVAATSSVASAAAHGRGNTMKLKKSDLVSGGDGEDVRAAIHGLPREEVSSSKKILPTNLSFRPRGTKLSKLPESPSSCNDAHATGEASSPLSRKKRRRRRIHLVPVEKRSEPPPPPSNIDGDEHATREASDPHCSSRNNNIIKLIVMVRMPKSSNRSWLPSSCNDDAQLTVEASSALSRKKKRSKRIHLVPVVMRPESLPINVDGDNNVTKKASTPICRKNNIIKRIVTVRLPKHSNRPESTSSNTNRRRKKDTAAFICMPSSDSIEALLEEDIMTPKQKKNDHIQPDHPGSQGGEFSADFGKGKHMLRGEEKRHTSVTAYFSGDATIHKADVIEPANTMDPPRLDRDIEQSHAVDNCLDVSPRMNQLVPSANSHGMSISREIPWTRYKMINTDHEQELVPEEIQNLLDLDHEAIMSRISFLSDKLNRSPAAEVEFCSTYDGKQLAEVYKRLYRYCIEAHELSLPGEEPDDTQLNDEHVYDFFLHQHGKEDREWYFHPVQCKLAVLDDYQQLVLRDDSMFRDWDYYRLTYHTYHGDVEYVQFCEEMSEKIKWIEDEAALFGDQWPRYELVAFLQSLEIAVQFHNIFARSVMSGLSEHLDSLRFYIDNRKDWDGVYLEIWKRFAKHKMKFEEVLRQLHQENIFPSRKPEIKIALDSYPGASLIKYNYENFVDHIDAELSEEKARPLIIHAVEKMFPRRKHYLDYARKKMEIAARIGLIPKSSLEVKAPQGG